MKNLLLSLLLLVGFSAEAIDLITATITVTNTAGTTNGQTLTINSDVRTWTNSVQVPASQILTNSMIGGSATNMFNQIAGYPFTGLNLAHSGTNGITLQTAPGGPLSVSLSAGWGTVVLTTNTLTSATVVRIPTSLEAAAVRTNVNSGLTAALRDPSNTNVLYESDPVMTNFVGVTNVQTISGAKTFTGGLSSLGSAPSSEQFGTGSSVAASNACALGPNTLINATADYSAAVGYLSHISAGSSNSSAIGYFAVIAGGSPNSAAVGPGAFIDTQTPGGTALGKNATVNNHHTNSTALGQSASTTAKNQMRLATSSEYVSIPGNLVVDGSISTSNQFIGNGLNVTNMSGTNLIPGSVKSAQLAPEGLAISGTNTLPAGGDIAFGRYALSSLANGNNAAIVVGTNVFVEVSGPSGAFTINGVAGGRDGKYLIILNQTGQNMTIAHESGVDPTAANRITTMTGADRATTGNGAAILIYSGAASRWILISLDT